MTSGSRLAKAVACSTIRDPRRATFHVINRKQWVTGSGWPPRERAEGLTALSRQLATGGSRAGAGKAQRASPGLPLRRIWNGAG
jgi:hypothetical protein